MDEKRKHDGLVFEILARIISNLSSREEGASRLEYNHESLSPAEFRKRMVVDLTTATWSSPFVVNLLSVLKDVLLADEEQKEILEKAINMMPSLDFSVLPAFVYQILLFSYKNKGEIVIQIAKFFTNQESKIEAHEQDVLRQVQGTVLIHMDVALKQDSALATSFLKTLQKEPWTPSCFMLAFLLALSRSQRHQDQVMKMLMHTITSGIQEEVVNSAHIWADAALKEGRGRRQPIKNVLIATIRRAQHGWQSIVGPLVTLGFTCMETRTKAKTTSHLLRALGSEMLQVTFETHAIVRGDILSHVFSRFTATGSDAPAFIELLAVLIEKYWHQVMESEAKLREAFDYLTFLKPSIGLQLVDAIMPLLQHSKGFQDHLMIVFRKAMFRGDLASRLTAVGGFARWITYAPLDDSLAHDVLMFLNRGLTQQCEVRNIVYGAMEHILPKQTDLVRNVIEMLLEQISRYLPNGAKAINLKACLEGDTVMEPIGSLISAAQKCAQYGKASLEPESTKSRRAFELSDRVELFVSLIEESDLSDFDLDKSSDFSQSHNVALGALLLNSYVVGIEAIIGVVKISEASMGRAITLYKKHAVLLEAMQSSSASGNGDGDGGAAKKRKKAASSTAGAAGGGTSSKLTLPVDKLMGTDEISNLLRSFADPSEQNSIVAQMIRDETEFYQWGIQHLHCIVMAEVGPESAVADLSRSAIATKKAFCNSVGFYIMSEYKRDHVPLKASLMTAECLLCMMDFIDHHSTNPQQELADFLEVCNPIFANSQPPEAQKALQGQLASILTFLGPLLQNSNFKETLLILRLCSVLVRRIRAENLAQLLKETQDLLLFKMDNVATAQALVHLHLEICEKSGAADAAASRLIADLRALKGPMSEEDEEDEPVGVTSGIVGEKTWQLVAMQVLELADRLIGESDWALGVLKGNEASGQFSLSRLRHATYGRFLEAIKILDGLAGTNFGLESSVRDATLKHGTKLIRGLCVLTKTLMQQKHVPLHQFTEVVAMTGKLIAKLYKLFSNQSVEVEGEGDDDDEDDDNKTSMAKRKRVKLARVKKDERIQPMLIYEIERLETSLLKYQKQCKTTLMHDWTRSVERGYQLDMAKAAKLAANMEMEEEEEEEEEQSDDEEQTKRKKKQPPKPQRKKPRDSDPDMPNEATKKPKKRAKKTAEPDEAAEEEKKKRQARAAQKTERVAKARKEIARKVQD